MPGSARPRTPPRRWRLGYDAVLLNTAVAKAGDPVKMAAAFARAIEAGRLAFEAGLIEPRDMAVALDACRRHAVLQDRQRLLTGFAYARGAILLSLDPFYPILPDTEWLARLLPQGIRLVQLRIKDKPAAVVRAEIAKAVALCRAHRCELVVNDYWRRPSSKARVSCISARRILARADLSAIKSAGIRLGVSTHSDTS